MVHHDALVVLISRTTRMTCSADSDGRVAVGGYQSINLAKAVEDSDPGYRGEACQPLDLDLVDLEVKGYFRIGKVQPGYGVVGKMNS